MNVFNYLLTPECLSIFGGFGLLVFGVRVFSESLQSIASRLIQRVMRLLSTDSSPLVGVLSGTAITMLVQSNSTMTVAVVGSVNAGIMGLEQAIAVMAGANIGATLTGWVLAIDVGSLYLLLLGLGSLPLVLVKGQRFADLGRTILALGLLYFAMELLADALLKARVSSGNIDLANLSIESVKGLFFTVLGGAFFTALVQSSAVAIAFTMALATSGCVDIHAAVALVIGVNLGTSITAFFAARRANLAARRAAVAQALFNGFGFALCMIVFNTFTDFIQTIIPLDATFALTSGRRPFAALHVAAAHTVFNILCALLFVPFVGRLTLLVKSLAPRKDQKIVKHLDSLGGGMPLSAALALSQTKLALDKMAALVARSLDQTRVYVLDPQTSQAGKRILRYEGITDSIHDEIVKFLEGVMKIPLSTEESHDIKKAMFISDELESVADYCQKVVAQNGVLVQKQLKFGKDTLRDLDLLFDLVIRYYAKVADVLKNGGAVDGEWLESMRAKYNEESIRVRDAVLHKVSQEKMDATVSMVAQDIVMGLSRMISHTRKIAEALMEKSFKLKVGLK